MSWFTMRPRCTVEATFPFLALPGLRPGLLPLLGLFARLGLFALLGLLPGLGLRFEVSFFGVDFGVRGRVGVGVPRVLWGDLPGDLLPGDFPLGDDRVIVSQSIKSSEIKLAIWTTCK